MWRVRPVESGTRDWRAKGANPSRGLELRDVCFSRGNRAIFRDLSISVGAGEMVALIGPNGVGKSTLLKMVSRLLRPDSGTILLSGRDVAEWDRKELSSEVALVPQHLEMPFAFRVEEIVAQGRVPHLRRFGGLSARDRDVVEQAMEATDVTSLRDRVFADLSGGERQRVKLAIGLAQEPHLMLLDEPTQHLDIGRQIELISLMQKLNARGITIIAAMHDLALVRENFSSAILLTPEPASMTGTTEELLNSRIIERAFSVDPTMLFRCYRPDAMLGYGD